MNVLNVWPSVHKAFKNQDQYQTQVKSSFTMDFLWNLLYLFNYWLMVFDKICTPNMYSWKSKLFSERNGHFYICERYDNLGPIKTVLYLQCLQKSSFLAHITGNSSFWNMSLILRGLEMSLRVTVRVIVLAHVYGSFRQERSRDVQHLLVSTEYIHVLNKP